MQNKLDDVRKTLNAMEYMGSYLKSREDCPMYKSNIPGDYCWGSVG
jgi:hypothetical protein